MGREDSTSPNQPVSQPDKFCLDCGYPIDGIDSHACPECGRPFDPEDRTTYRRSLSYPKKVYTTTSQSDAHMMVHVLAQAGIPAIVMEGFPGMTGLGASSVYVESPDAEAANTVISHETERRQQPQPTNVDPAWICPNCGEEVDGNFEICWNCGAERPLEP